MISSVTVQPPDESSAAAAGGVAADAALRHISDVAVAPDGSLYVVSSFDHQVFHIGQDGTVQIAAGTGSAGFSGDGGPATEAELDEPTGVDVGADGTLYILDSRRLRIRAVTTDGVITTIGGNETYEASNYDDDPRGVPATDVYFTASDLVVDDAGTVYFTSHGAIRAIGPDGIMTTLAGDDANAFGITVDGSDNVYFTQIDDSQVSVLHKVSERSAPEPASSDDDQDGAGTPWWAMVIGVLLAAGLVARYAVRRRRSTRTPPTD
ncbi:NHL domain-containing protein [Phytoactinopolyspora halotolerans]|uniref:Teneurin NHL domain-containing protein n=1 Tax=Phytoactinopolyspora halotolerans TaxID=1981512 RepID=A0A6L9SH06_9ACTN|nr:hypothetical protein [Phytoactinopolyspora halotolerans]NEE04373.1 hypothetical protein [Phytoactinopolyspora halotolerans]